MADYVKRKPCQNLQLKLLVKHGKQSSNVANSNLSGEKSTSNYYFLESLEGNLKAVKVVPDLTTTDLDNDQGINLFENL